jgi:sulfate adenylyltransferase
MASLKTCDHSQDERVFLSGTKVRELLDKKQLLPSEFTRPEVAEILIEANGGKTSKEGKEVAEVKERT